MEIGGLKIQNLMGVEILATAAAFPENGRFISNAEINSLRFGENWEEVFRKKNYDAQFIEKEYGFANRYWTHTPGTKIIASELNSADLMFAASEKAIKNAEIDKQDIGLFIAVTVTSPKYTNSMGTYVAGKLGLNCPAFEIKTGCASAIYALILAAQFLHSGTKYILIAAGETPTKVTATDTNLLYAVGDGGAAVVLSATQAENKGILQAFIGSDGKYSGTMGTPGLLPPNQEDLDNKKYYMEMGKENDEVIEELWQVIPNILYLNSGLEEKDITLLIPHQVNKKMINLVSEASGVSKENTIDLISNYANCGSASVLIALDHAMKNNRLIKDSAIMMVAVGGGISYGGIILNI